MSYYFLQNLILDGVEYSVGDEVEDLKYAFKDDLLARNLVTTRPLHRNPSARGKGSDAQSE